jgi:hypothetical protein
MRHQKPSRSVVRLSDDICSGITISVVIVASERSVMMFIDALYVRIARYKSSARSIQMSQGASYNVRAPWMGDVPALRRRAVEGDEKHCADSPHHSDCTRSVHHSSMHLYRCDGCERKKQEAFRSNQRKYGEDFATVQRL